MPHWSIFILIIPSQSQLGISSHHLFTVMAFRAISLSTFQAFRATIFLQLGVQSRSLGIQSRLISLVRIESRLLQFRRSKPLGIQGHLLQFKHAEPSSSVRRSKSHSFVRRSEPSCTF